MKHEHAIAVVAREQAALVQVDAPRALGPSEVRGRTVSTLLSPGTEIAWAYRGATFPQYPGYAAVFEVQETGAEVTGRKPGDLLFCTGPHRSYQQVAAANTVPVPAGLAPQLAVLCRLMGVSMTTLVTTAARPGNLVLVTGLGPVGFLAAHAFSTSGYRVVCCEPSESRRAAAQGSGLRDVRASVPRDDPALAGQVALAVECSGHEQAVLDCCAVVREGGEVALVGVPWQKRTERSAHDLLTLVFHRYVRLRSGWEWEIPNHESQFHPHSVFGNFATALQWLADGRVKPGATLREWAPSDAAEVYARHAAGKAEELFSVFQWGRGDE